VRCAKVQLPNNSNVSHTKFTNLIHGRGEAVVMQRHIQAQTRSGCCLPLGSGVGVVGNARQGGEASKLTREQGGGGPCNLHHQAKATHREKGGTRAKDELKDAMTCTGRIRSAHGACKHQAGVGCASGGWWLVPHLGHGRREQHPWIRKRKGDKRERQNISEKNRRMVRLPPLSPNKDAPPKAYSPNSRTRGRL
jgi:hypothetical protein